MNKGRLVIAEDERIIAMDLSDRMTSIGFGVLGVAGKGAEAVALVGETQPDLVLMDIYLGGEMDGIQAAQTIRHEYDIPVIFITAHSDDATLQRAMAAEPYGYILKPFDDRELSTSIELALFKADIERRLRESEARYRAIVEDQTDLVIRYTPDTTLTFVNEAFCRFFNAPREFFIGKTYQDWASGYLNRETTRMLSQYTPQQPIQTFELKMTLPDGSTHWVQWRTRGIFFSRDILSEVQAVGRDITEAKQLEESLLESRERYFLAAEGANDGIWDWDLVKNRFYFSERMKISLGYDGNDFSETVDDWLALIDPIAQAQVEAAFNEHMAGDTPILYTECRLRRKDGSYGWFAIRGLAVSKTGQAPHRIAGSLTDISPYKEYQELLTFKAFHDELTGLANRSLLISRLQHALDRYRMPRQGMAAVLFLDLDFFKLVNDSYGHQTGDKLLKIVARRIEESVRPGDTIARFGGDEFAVMLEDINEIADAVLIAQRIQQQMTTPFLIEGKNVYISCSIGICDTNEPNCDPDSILRNADIAMYHAKAKGRGLFEIFDPVMHSEVLSLLERDRELHHALDHNELELLFQPIISLSQRRVARIEVQLGWQHPRHGLISSQDFVETVIEAGLVHQITDWMLKRACAELKRLQQLGYPDLSMGIALTISQLALSDIVTMIQINLEENDLPPELLEIGIGEPAFSKYFDHLAATLSKLSELGVQLAVSEFGSQSAFWSKLRHFQIKRLWLEQAILKQIGSDKARSVEQMLLGLARSVNLEVAVKGVETLEEVAVLRGQDCDEFQGSLICDAVRYDDLLDFLSSQQERVSQLTR